MPLVGGKGIRDEDEVEDMAILQERLEDPAAAQSASLAEQEAALVAPELGWELQQ